MNKNLICFVACAIVITAWLYTSTEDAATPQISSHTVLSYRDVQERNRQYRERLEAAKALDLASGEARKF